MNLSRLNKYGKPVLITLISALVISVFGSAIGSYCWYEYTARANATYSGTAAGTTDKLSIGLISENKLENFDIQHSLKEDSTSLPGSYIYWAIQEQSLGSNAILDYETRRGYASNQMLATSSLSNNTGDAISLHQAPTYLTHSDRSLAAKSAYSNIRFAFKVPTSQVGFNINIRNSTIKCDCDVKEGVRIHFSNPTSETSSFIFNPSSQNDGATNVGGLLNLNTKVDDLYDYEIGTDREYIYGEVENVTYSGEKYTGQKEVDPADITTFKSNHKAGYLIPTITPKKATYLGTQSVFGRQPITSTDPITGIAEANATIYLEGWDHSVIDKNIGYSYDLKLEFSYSARD